jgi:2-hydroxychromene-2-carboxylate isomerase
MMKHLASVVGIAVAASFVVLFFHGRAQTRELTEVAPRTGMSVDELMALGPSIKARTGVTLGSSRRVVYLLACSGRANRSTLESQAVRAGMLARQQHLTDREAVSAVLNQDGIDADGLKAC